MSVDIDFVQQIQKLNKYQNFYAEAYRDNLPKDILDHYYRLSRMQADRLICQYLLKLRIGEE